MSLFTRALLVGCVGISSWASALDCENAISTLEMNECAFAESKKLEDTLASYFAKAIEILQETEESEAAAALEKSQASWLTYRNDYCDAIYQLWIGGSIRSIMTSACSHKLTYERTLTIWQDYLVTMDGHEFLPEPKKPK